MQRVPPCRGAWATESSDSVPSEHINPNEKNLMTEIEKRQASMLRATRRIIETIELCRLGVWEEHRPALDSILRDFKSAGFDVDDE
jgi:hypothetical protein